MLTAEDVSGPDAAAAAAGLYPVNSALQKHHLPTSITSIIISSSIAATAVASSSSTSAPVAQPATAEEAEG